MFKVKSYFLVKKQGYRHSVDNLKYPKDLVLKLKWKDNLVNQASSTPLLTYNFKSCSKDRNKTIIP